MNYNGLCTFNQFVELFPEHLIDEEGLDLLRKGTIQKFMRLLMTDSVSPTKVLARMRDIRLCYAYCRKNGCKRNRCSCLHLCRSYIAGYCSKQEECKLSHNTEDKQNAKVLETVGLPKSIPKDLILQLIRNSLPCLCLDHLTEQGCEQDSCYKFHICSQHIKRSCRKSSQECRFGHSFDTAHNEAILKMFDYTLADITGNVLAPDIQPVKRYSGNSTTDGRSTPVKTTFQEISQSVTPDSMKYANNVSAEKDQETDIQIPARPVPPPRSKRNREPKVLPQNSSTFQKTSALDIPEHHLITVSFRSVPSNPTIDKYLVDPLDDDSTNPSTSPPSSVPTSQEKARACAQPSADEYRNVTTNKMPPSGTISQEPFSLHLSDKLGSEPNFSSQENVKPASPKVLKEDACTEIRLLLNGYDSPSIPICHKFIAKSCYNQQCNMHHHPMPYLWCYMVNSGWKAFDSKMSQMIEEQYCRPEKSFFKVICNICTMSLA